MTAWRRFTLGLVAIASAWGCGPSIVETDGGPDAGDPWVALELTLDRESTTVGTPVGYTAELVSQSGVRDAAVVELASDLEPGLSYGSATLTPTVAGTHRLTASATPAGGATLTDTATLVVGDGVPVSLEITLSDETPDIERNVDVTATILDSQGAELDLPWTLTVTAEPGSDPSSVTVTGHRMIFSQEGWFTATGTLDSNAGITDSFGPFVVDSYPPTISITNPERGAWRTSTSDTVTGTITDSFSAIAEATCNGSPLTLGADGSFSYPITYAFGTNRIETLATDAGDTTTTDRRAVLEGAFNPRGQAVSEGILARVNQTTIDAIEGFAEEMIEGYDIGAMIPDPVTYQQGGCVLDYCAYRLTLRITGFSMGGVDVELDPTASGYIAVSASMRNVRVDWNATGNLTAVGYDTSGTITADAVTVTGRLTPSVSGGQVHVAVTNIAVTSTNFVFDWDSWIYDVADFFGINVSGIVRGYVEDAIRTAVEDEVPPLLEDALQGLELSTSFALMDNTYALRAEPESVAVDDAGLSLGLRTSFDPVEWRLGASGLGSLYAHYSVPALGTSPGLIAAFSMDFFNQALYAFWGGGMLTRQFDAASLGVDPAMLGLLMEELADVQNIVVNAMLPPVVLPGEGTHLGQLQVGDLEVTMHSGDPSDPSTLLLRMFVAAEAGLDLSVTAENTLSFAIADPQAWFDVTEPVAPHDFETSTEELLVSLVPLLLGQVTDALGEIPIPEIQGFSMTGVTIGSAGAERGYVNVGGELTGL